MGDHGDAWPQSTDAPLGETVASVAPIGVAVVAFAVLQSGVVPIISAVERDLGASQEWAAWLVTVYLMVSITATPAMGRLADLYGRRRMMLIGLIIFAASCLLAAVAPNTAVLLVARSVQGVGGAVYPLALALGRQRSPRGAEQRTVGLLTMGFGAGTALGFVGGGLIAEFVSWRWLFVGGAALIVIGMLLVARRVPADHAEAEGRFDLRGTIILSVASWALLIALTLVVKAGWTSPVIIGLLAVAAVAGVGWSYAERRTANPLIDLHVLGNRQVATVNLVAIAIGWGVFSTFLLLPRVAEHRPGDYGLGLGPASAGLLLLPIAVGQMIAAVAAVRWNRTGVVHRLVAGSLVIMAAALVALSLLRSGVLAMAGAGLLLGLGMGAAIEASSSVASSAVEPDVVAASSSLNSTVRRLGGGVGGQVSTLIIAAAAVGSAPRFPAFRFGYGTGAALCLLAALVGWIGTRPAGRG